MPDFPVLDAPRTRANAEYNRVIFDSFGYIEPHIAELDDWTSLPLRLIYDDSGGWQLEVGPYTLNHADIERLRSAIAAYDLATGTHDTAAASEQ